MLGNILVFIQQRKTLLALIGGVILGLILGLLIGWVIAPVQYTDVGPGDLRSDFRGHYLLYVAREYASTRDLSQARVRLGAEYWKAGGLDAALTGLEGGVSGQDAVAVRSLREALGTVPLPAPEAAAGTPAATAGGGTLVSLVKLCGGALLVVALVGGIWLLLTRLRKQRAEPRAVERGLGAARGRAPVEKPAWKEEGEPPLVQFVTTYKMGDEHYDPSFSIELENGEFMGECGVGLSETIGVGEPSRVTAFEVWLFDKSDIRTVTKVLMSDYAFHDEAMRTKLAPKGEPVLAEVGKDAVLETKTLRIRARVVEAEYGAGNMPSNSFFERFTVELATWVLGPGDQPTVGGDDLFVPPA